MKKRGLGRSLIRRPSIRAYGRGFLVGGWQRCTCPSHSNDKNGRIYLSENIKIMFRSKKTTPTGADGDAGQERDNPDR